MLFQLHKLRPSSTPQSLIRSFLCACVHQSSLLGLILAELGKGDTKSMQTRRDWCRQLVLRFPSCLVPQALLRRGTTHPEQDADEENPLIDSTAGTSATKPKLTCIFASFDAWLFADSDVLWAVLISEIFKQARVFVECWGGFMCVFYVFDVRSTAKNECKLDDKKKT